MIRVWRFVRTVVREFLHDHGPIMAAAMSFFATLSLFPLLLFGVSALGYVVGSQKAFHQVMDFFQSYAPGPVADIVRTTLGNIVATRGKVLAVGVLVLLWTATGAFVNMETALCMTWDVEKRKFLKSRLLATAMLLLVGAGLLVSLAFTAITLRIEGLHWRVFGHQTPDLPVFWHAMGYLVPILLGVAMFTATYYILPNTRVHFRAALLGGVVGGLLWHLALLGFRWYLKHYGHFDVVYGSLGGVIILVMWIYYSMIVLLLGAELAWQADQRLRHQEGNEALSPAEKLSSPAPMP
jgi:membrane protein